MNKFFFNLIFVLAAFVLPPLFRPCFYQEVFITVENMPTKVVVQLTAD